MNKAHYSRLLVIVAIILLASFLLAACEDGARVRPAYTYNPGVAFSTNFNDEDPRRQIRCSIVFEVIDEAATTELEPFNYIIRNSVLTVLGELTLEQLTTNRDLEAIAARIVLKVNEDLSGVKIFQDERDLITRAFFTDFVLA